MDAHPPGPRTLPVVVIFLGLAWLAALNGRGPTLSLGPVLPLVQRDLGMASSLAGLATSLPVILMGLMALPGGLLVDRLGPGRALTVALLGVGLGGGARAFAGGVPGFLAATLVLGSGVAVMQAALPAVARAALPEQPGLATAVYFNGLTLGVFAGTALVPVLLAWSGHAGWRGVFGSWGAYGVVCADLWAVTSRKLPHRLAASPSTEGLLASVRAAWRLPGFPATVVAFGAQSAVFYAFLSWLPSELVRRGWEVPQASGPAALVAAGALAAGFGTPALIDLVGRRLVLLAAGLTTTVAAAGVLLASAEAAWLWALLAGFGTTVAFGVALAVPAELAPPERVGSTAGTLLTLGYVLSALGPLPVGILLDLTGSTRPGWAYILTVALALVAAAARTPTRPERTKFSQGAQPAAR